MTNRTETRYTVVWAECPNCYSYRIQATVQASEEFESTALKVWCEDCESVHKTAGREVVIREPNDS